MHFPAALEQRTVLCLHTQLRNHTLMCMRGSSGSSYTVDSVVPYQNKREREGVNIISDKDYSTTNHLPAVNHPWSILQLTPQCKQSCRLIVAP